MVVSSSARGPLVGTELNVARSQASACKDLLFSRRPHAARCLLQLAPSLIMLSRALSDHRPRVCLSSPTLSFRSTAIAISRWRLAHRTHTAAPATGVYFSHEDSDQPRQSPPLCPAQGGSDRRLSGCLITCGLCVHVDPLFGEKEAIFEDVLCALHLKYGKLALRSNCWLRPAGLGRKSKTCL